MQELRTFNCHLREFPAVNAQFPCSLAMFSYVPGIEQHAVPVPGSMELGIWNYMEAELCMLTQTANVK
jgi:hypothetical protein